MFTVLSEEFSLVTEWINDLRNVSVQTDRMKFRRNMERVGEIAAFEISKHLPYKEVEITTPLDKIVSREIETQPVITTILRAGVPLFQGVLNYFDKADCGFVAAYRKHDANDYFSIKQDYLTCPNIEGRPLIVADPMLATGASLIEAIKDLLTNGNPSQIHIVAAIASKEGVETLQKAYPEAYIWVGAVDEKLTDKGYITPGLGDAGDLSYGEKLQR
ncbi:uracil phosphoribosyltransferase [Riemerella anatipestifer]|nr:uracil phosphoribosyltransferase [Riemerella anatipestifer]MBO4234731.1 uracil phosphoribosyltransferase [Riemerella anatipestifer]MBT0526882.1 uracil phosphoribosyltransferase [Riemerella anatipestifer]MBT0527844.1 uracil phosphoribosyltransferase [Riemerella anatipestifer]MBT0529884.1 uracil phosphoribosyltransferase [Riemerella anatipestifer]MBT0531370.1 uracil phosphoribosyltransferase [Riemerella anatipestifer]